MSLYFGDGLATAPLQACCALHIAGPCKHADDEAGTSAAAAAEEADVGEDGGDTDGDEDGGGVDGGDVDDGGSEGDDAIDEGASGSGAAGSGADAECGSGQRGGRDPAVALPGANLGAGVVMREDSASQLNRPTEAAGGKAEFKASAALASARDDSPSHARRASKRARAV